MFPPDGSEYAEVTPDQVLRLAHTIEPDRVIWSFELQDVGLVSMRLTQGGDRALPWTCWCHAHAHARPGTRGFLYADGRVSWADPQHAPAFQSRDEGVRHFLCWLSAGGERKLWEAVTCAPGETTDAR